MRTQRPDLSSSGTSKSATSVGVIWSILIHSALMTSLIAHWGSLIPRIAIRSTQRQFNIELVESPRPRSIPSSVGITLEDAPGARVIQNLASPHVTASIPLASTTSGLPKALTKSARRIRKTKSLHASTTGSARAGSSVGSAIARDTNTGVRTSTGIAHDATAAHVRPLTPAAELREADARAEGWLLSDSDNRAPQYPRVARQLRQEGRLRVLLRVENGAVRSAEIERTSGYPLLDRAALDALRSWRFRADLNIVYLQGVRFELK